MKILLAGDWHSDIHEKPLSEAFQQLGHEVSSFAWSSYFRRSISDRFQNKFLMGPIFQKVNQDLLQQIADQKPDVVFVYRGTHVKSETIRSAKLSNPHTRWVGYNNDDPFSRRNPIYLWRHFLRSIPEYDLMFAYRQLNVHQFRERGAKHVELLRSWYIPKSNRKVNLTPEQKQEYGCDVVFVGHYENDGRKKIIELLSKQKFSFKLYGPEWSKVLKKNIPVPRGESYNIVINAAQIALCFLSKLNQDTYTRRCFEIPAAGTFLMSEYSEDLTTLFEEGKEAEYFRNTEELIQKLNFYLANPERLKAVANAGHERVMRDGHDVLSRAQQIIKSIASI